jgi:hypothetical protein
LGNTHKRSWFEPDNAENNFLIFGEIDGIKQNSGSRNSDGNVPNVNFNDDKVNVNWYNSSNANSNLRARSVEVSKKEPQIFRALLLCVIPVPVFTMINSGGNQENYYEEICLPQSVFCEIILAVDSVCLIHPVAILDISSNCFCKKIYFLKSIAPNSLAILINLFSTSKFNLIFFRMGALPSLADKAASIDKQRQSKQYSSILVKTPKRSRFEAFLLVW